LIAALYARVSTRDKGQNPETQLEPILKYCNAMGWEVYQEYEDKTSASDLVGRIAWTALMKDASLHKYDTLRIWKLDRAFRSMTQASTTLNILNAYHDGFRSLMDPAMDTTTPNGQLLFNILASVAQFEKDLIVQRVNAGMDYAKEHGTKSGFPIGRKSYDIPFVKVCKALIDAKGNLTHAAVLLNTECSKKVSPGFVLSRITRAGFSKADVLSGKALQMVGDNIEKNQIQY
jgi:DNA invertase Pin-like site-specific DNA recombinase